ncbi:MAG: hypothetical protein QF814_06450, partial [Candidatus Marinimicrobia bacterium]|nr:hypothetical protein [Candidatus Neomarinimicrobiota bacterium]
MTNLKNKFFLFIGFIAVLSWRCTQDIKHSNWPTYGWIVSTPEEQDMNPDSLLTLSKKLESGDLGYIDGMLIIRNGKIIFEEQYSNNYDSLFNTTNTEPGKYNYYDPNWHPYYK